MYSYSNHLGFSSPYYYELDDKIVSSINFKQAISSRKRENFIDITAIIELINKEYILGDRTMIKGIFKSPWMTEVNKEKIEWKHHLLPEHKENILSEEKISNLLYKRLYDELNKYIYTKSNVGILLSGGMDSRIVAGIIFNIIKNENLKTNIIGLTWGFADSRDVVYAKKICKKLGWEWKHFVVGEEELLDNIKIAAIHGAEFSPIHLHAMGQIANLKGLDCVIAGSYGDSIGRGEYSGQKVLNLKRIDSNIRNIGFYLNHGLVSNNMHKINEDVNNYHKLFPQEKNYMMIEQDYQLHYMRRMLSSCMDIINEKIPVYQAFTDPEVFGFIWSIHPKLRNNKLYNHIILKHLSFLKDIPWARTGKIYMSNEGNADKFKKQHHSYGINFFSPDVLNEIKPLIFSNGIRSLNIFNFDVIESTLKINEKYPIYNKTWYQGFFLWLASLSIMIDEFNVKTDLSSCNILSGAINKINHRVLSKGEFYAKKVYSKIW